MKIKLLNFKAYYDDIVKGILFFESNTDNPYFLVKYTLNTKNSIANTKIFSSYDNILGCFDYSKLLYVLSINNEVVCISSFKISNGMLVKCE